MSPSFHWLHLVKLSPQYAFSNVVAAVGKFEIFEKSVQWMRGTWQRESCESEYEKVPLRTLQIFLVPPPIPKSFCASQWE